MISLILRIGNLSAGIQASFRGLEYPFHLRLPSATTSPIHPRYLFQSSPQKWPASCRNTRPTCVGIRTSLQKPAADKKGYKESLIKEVKDLVIQTDTTLIKSDENGNYFLLLDQKKYLKSMEVYDLMNLKSELEQNKDQQKKE